VAAGAGATEVMVLFSAGKLNARRLVNLWNLPELREIRENAGSLTLGAVPRLAQFADAQRCNGTFPCWRRRLLGRQHCESESATLAGNLANASPPRIRLPRCWRMTQSWNWCPHGDAEDGVPGFSPWL